MKRNLKALFIRIPCVLSITACSTAVLAQTNDELVLQYINDVCSRAAPNTPLEQACLATQGPGPHVGNAGSIGALGTTSAGVAYLSQRATERKEKKEQQEEKKKPSGGGASADFQLGKLGVFANLAYMDGTRDTTVKENGFDITQYGLTAGSDYRYNDKLFSGAALNINKSENTLSNNAGNLDSKNFSLTIFGNYFLKDNLAVDGYVSAATFSYDSTRHIVLGPLVADASANYNAQQFGAGTAGTYSYYIKSLTLSGVAKLDYNTTDIDAYDENDGGGFNFSYQKQTIESFTAKLGIQAGYALSMPWGVLQPQARLHYVHEFSNDSRTINSTLVLAQQEAPLALTTDAPDRNYFLGAVGASTVMPNGLQTFLDLEFLSGHSYLSTWTATLGVRWEL